MALKLAKGSLDVTLARVRRDVGGSKRLGRREQDCFDGADEVVRHAAA
jgi:hypothetical protein